MQLINICDDDSLFGSAKLYGTPSRGKSNLTRLLGLSRPMSYTSEYTRRRPHFVTCTNKLSPLGHSLFSGHSFVIAAGRYKVLQYLFEVDTCFQEPILSAHI